MDDMHFEPRLDLRVENNDGYRQVFAMRPEESLFVRVKFVRVRLTSADERFEAAADLVVTRTRIVLMVGSSMNAPGLDSRAGEVALVSVERAELAAPRVTRSILGKIKCVDLADSAGAFVIQITYTPNFENFLEVIGPEFRTEFGDERAAEIEEVERVAAAEALQAAEAAETKRTQRLEEQFARSEAQPLARRGPLAVPSLGLLDHRKTWRYRLAATPEQCIDGFARAFSGRGGVVVKAKWEVKRRPTEAVATYQGRKGVTAAVSLFSETAQAEEEGALGSEVRFEVEQSADGRIDCAMWLASRGTRAGFTNDGRFFRPYMRAVEAELRRVDPSLQVVKE